ncbi:hypothetical protein Misp03_15280 [Microbispora sp. NBRC 16548]|nr:hypothetical protein Misp03_15280 [Microbispora sp. NBRC 16548]
MRSVTYSMSVSLDGSLVGGGIPFSSATAWRANPVAVPDRVAGCAVAGHRKPSAGSSPWSASGCCEAYRTAPPSR